MKIIVITTEAEFPNEAARIAEFLDSGVHLVHIRKPSWALSQMESLIEEIPQQYHQRLVIHSHFDLCLKYKLHGIHLGLNRMDVPPNHRGSTSFSCHSIDELELSQHYDYCTISPIFDSISKQGYTSKFSIDELSRAVERGIINSNTFALGGVTYDNIELLEQIGFHGACLLGAAWK